MGEGRAEKQSAKPTKSSGLIIVITLAVIILFAVWVFAFKGAEQLNQQNVAQLISPQFQLTPVNETYRFINYRNPTWGFSVDYPVGFAAEEPTLELPEFRAYAVGGLRSELPEVIEVIVDNSTTAEAEYRDAVSSTQAVSSIVKNPRGKTIRQLVATTEVPLASGQYQQATVFQAFFDCNQSNLLEEGPFIEPAHYTALLIISIPSDLPQDLPVAEYILSSFNC